MPQSNIYGMLTLKLFFLLTRYFILTDYSMFVFNKYSKLTSLNNTTIASWILIITHLSLHCNSPVIVQITQPLMAPCIFIS